MAYLTLECSYIWPFHFNNLNDVMWKIEKGKEIEEIVICRHKILISHVIVIDLTCMSLFLRNVHHRFH